MSSDKPLHKLKDIRAFFALEIKDKIIIENIKQLQNQLSRFVNPIKFVEPENIHLTMRFLGNISLETAKSLYNYSNELNEIYFKEPLEYELLGLNDFGKRVFFIDLKGNKEVLIEINKMIEDKLVNDFNFKPDPKFRTHVTIARKKKYGKGKGSGFLDKNKYNQLKHRYSSESLGKVKFAKLLLKKSTLAPTGPVYENLRF